MAFGSKQLKRGDKGKDVVELQLRLAGFRGTTWDGDFGPGTELQVIAFQRDYMKRANPSGKVDKASRVLLAMGFDEVTASSAIRVSMGPVTTEAEVMAFADAWIDHFRRRKSRAA